MVYGPTPTVESSVSCILALPRSWPPDGRLPGAYAPPGKEHALTVDFHRPSPWSFALARGQRAFSDAGIDLRKKSLRGVPALLLVHIEHVQTWENEASRGLLIAINQYASFACTPFRFC